MANKYSKSNISTKKQEQKTMEDYENDRSKLNKTARILAIIVIAAMVITTVIGAGMGVFF